jgi:hypothetical protein
VLENIDSNGADNPINDESLILEIIKQKKIIIKQKEEEMSVSGNDNIQIGNGTTISITHSVNEDSKNNTMSQSSKVQSSQSLPQTNDS